MFPPSPTLFSSRQVHTVSELTESLTFVLENEFPFVAISGEISNLRKPFSGHLYFTLKDSQAQIRCVLFKNQQRYLKNPLKEGAKVICKGRISVYKQRGEYQIIVDHVSTEGIGNLQLQFEQLKEKLLREGLFAPENKKSIPPLVRKICLITSPTGAAVHDFLKKALDRFPGLEVEILPAAVQGEKAAQEIIEQISAANKRGWADVIILTRGGGSLEDLASFNDENLARAIHSSTLPLVAAIGHEVDFTIADLVADHRSPTPTAAAEEVVFDYNQVQSQICSLEQRMATALTTGLQINKNRLEILEKHLEDPRKIIANFRLKIDHLTLNTTHLFSHKLNEDLKRYELHRQKLIAQSPERKIVAQQTRCHTLVSRLNHQLKEKLQTCREQLTNNASRLDTLSPLAVLGRGYALATTEEQKIIRSVQQVEDGDLINVRVEDGILKGVVKERKQK